MSKSKSVSHHEDLDRQEEIKGSSDRSFGLVFTVVFAIIGLWPLLDSGAPRWWSLAISAGFLGVSIVRPAVLAPLNKLWTRFGLLLHHVVNPIVMGILFFVVITPMALVFKATGKDILNLRLDSDAKSYWIERRPPGPAPETMKNQF